jgi:protocatechuate 3,4-dioxygenase beta subunit
MKTPIQNLIASILLIARQLLFIPILFCISCVADAQKAGETIGTLTSKLKSKELSAEQVLGESKYLPLHYEDGFRSLIRDHAPTGKINIVTSSETGQRIRIKGVMLDKKDKSPLANQLFYFYHTMSSGYYGENTDKAKLFGYLRTNKNGTFEIQTIKPGGYPGEKFPAHVHVEVYGPEGQAIFGTEFQFADDPRMDKEMEATSLRHGNLISKNTGSAVQPVYEYKIEVPSR